MAVLCSVGRVRGIAPAEIQVQRGLVEIGFKSLDLAHVVALLEQRLDVDPFEHEPITDVRTVEDLCASYERALADEPAADPRADASVRRRSTPEPSVAQRRRAAREGPEES